VYRQSYTPDRSRPLGYYEDGSVAVVDSTYGGGRTLLAGTAVGSAYFREEESAAPWFGGVLEWADVEHHVWLSDGALTGRLHAGSGGYWLWLTNPTRRGRRTEVHLGSAWPAFSGTEVLWGTQDNVRVRDGELDVVVEARDGLVLKLVGERK
jgi:beta-galactosidase